MGSRLLLRDAVLVVGELVELLQLELLVLPVGGVALLGLRHVLLRNDVYLQELPVDILDVELVFGLRVDGRLLLAQVGPVDALEEGVLLRLLQREPSLRVLLQQPENEIFEVFAEVVAHLDVLVQNDVLHLVRGDVERRRPAEGRFADHEFVEAASQTPVVDGIVVILCENLRRQILRRPHNSLIRII